MPKTNNKDDEVGTPTFEHDCPHCIFLGYESIQAGVYDLYICEAHICKGTTLLTARYGSSHNDWVAMSSCDILKLNGKQEPLLTAFRRAMGRQLVSKTDMILLAESI